MPLHIFSLTLWPLALDSEGVVVVIYEMGHPFRNKLRLK